MKRFVEKPSKLEVMIMLRILKEYSATATFLSMTMEKPRTSLNYHLLNLEFSGFLRSFRDGRDTRFQLTSKGEEFLKPIVRSGFPGSHVTYATNRLGGSDESFDRCHSIYIKSPIVRMPAEEDMLKFGFQKGDHMRNWGQHYYGMRLEHCSVQATPRMFLFFLDEIFACNAHVATMLAFELVADAIAKLQDALPKLVLGEPERLAIMVRQHHALQDDILAHRCRHERISIATDRFEIDSSKGEPELEFVDPVEAPEDFEKYAKAKKEAGPEGYIELVDETIKGDFSPKGVNASLKKLTDIQEDVKEILNRMVPADTKPKSDPGVMHG